MNIQDIKPDHETSQAKFWLIHHNRDVDMVWQTHEEQFGNVVIIVEMKAEYLHCNQLGWLWLSDDFTDDLDLSNIRIMDCGDHEIWAFDYNVDVTLFG